MESLEKAEQLKNELDNLRPLDAEREARIMQKFRLDWNYHSNNLEGNSLTYGETKALILFGITAQGKPLKDHFEIQGHNEAINWILEVVKDKTVLTEAFIRQLHVLVLKEDHYIDALTSDGKPTRKLVKVGSYKTSPNHVLTKTGEMFYFATPEETPAKMEELVDWFRKEKEKREVNPIILAALFHYKFIRIHPFDDGNGRVARILMNFILMQFGYPPAIIKTEDKENYYAVLALADADELEPFIQYIMQNLIRSLEIMIKGAKGEDIEEPEDFDKELLVIEGRLKSLGKGIQKLKTQDSILRVFDFSLSPLLERFVELNKKFATLYQTFILHIAIKSGDTFYSSNGFSIEEMRRTVNQTTTFLRLSLTYKTLIQIHGIENFSYLSSIQVVFNQNNYIIEYSSDLIFQKDYSENLSEDEIKLIVGAKTTEHKKAIERVIDKVQSKLS